MYYKKSYYKKNSKGRFVRDGAPTIVKNNMTYGRWKRSGDLERAHGDKTSLVVKPTRSGLNYKVVSARTTFKGGNKKVRYDLITTSNRLPQNKKRKTSVSNRKASVTRSKKKCQQKGR